MKRFILLFVVFLCLFSSSVYGAYLESELTDNVIAEAIAKGTEYKTDPSLERMLTENGYRTILQHNNCVYILDVITPYFNIMEYSRANAKKYNTVTVKDAKEYIKLHPLTFRTYIISKNNNQVNKDDLYLIIKLLNPNTSTFDLIKPTLQYSPQSGYAGNFFYFGSAYFNFDINELLRYSNKLNYEFKAIHISNPGEIEFNIDFSKIK